MSEKLSNMTALPTAMEAGDIFYVVRGANWYKADFNDLPAGGGGSQDLQSVTDLGATTTNSVIFEDGSANLKVRINNDPDIGDITLFDPLDINNITTIDALKIQTGTVFIKDPTLSFVGSLNASNVTAQRDLEFPDQSGTIALTSDITTPTEEEIVGTSIETTFTGVGVLDLDTFVYADITVTSNSTLTVLNPPAVNTSFVRNLTVRSAVAETLSLPVAWTIIGSYVNDGSDNYFTILFSNLTTAGASVVCYINQA